MDLGLPLFKCRDCGRDVDDPTTHVCALTAPKKQAAPAAPRPAANSGRGYGSSPPSAPRSDDYGGRNIRGGRGQDDSYVRDHRPTDRYDRHRDDRYQDDRYNDRYGNDRRYDGHGGHDRHDSHNDQSDRRYNGSKDLQHDSGRRHEERGNSYDSYEHSAPSKDPYGAPSNGRVPSQEGSDVGAPNAPISGAAGAAKKGLDFLSLSVGKLFSGSNANAPADTKPDAAPPKPAATTTDSAIDGMSRHLADTRLEAADRYRRTSSPAPAAATPAPSAASTIPLSEIMLYKDAKSLTCTGACKGRIWKGEEIVLIGDDVLHAKCCVCAECSETAAGDEYGSDGWISHEPGRIIVCANCLENAHQPGHDEDAGYHRDEPPVHAPPKPTPLPPPVVAPEPDFPTCGTCRLSIMPGDQVVEHAKLPDMHHARCLDCAQCQRPLSATLSPTNPVHVRQGRPLCHPCYLQTLPRCGGCKNVITRDTRVVAALGRKYHPQCFGCVRCGKNFPDKSFYVLNNEPYDKWCYHEANGSLCGGCGHPIEGACACVVEGRFHPRCFCCAACHVALNDVYFAFEGRAFCEVHIAEVQRRRGGGKAERRQTFFKQMS
ncbi:Filamin-binding LIM protein 1 [Allomyces arbusculus]|nr:Filamin-binding LIM protein 1 [Allomyces arbusculus]